MAANKDISSYVLVLRDLGEEGGTGYALQLAPLQGRRARPTPPSPASGGPTSVAGKVGGVAAGAHGDTGGGGGSGTRATPTSPASHGPASVAATVNGVAAGAHGDLGGGGGSGTLATRTSPASDGPASVAVTVGDVAAGAHGGTGGGVGGTPNPTSPAIDGSASVAVTVGDVALAPGSHGGTGGGGGDGIEEVHEAAAAAARNPGQIRTLLQNRYQIISHKEEVLIPIFYAPKKNKDDIWDRRQVKYVVALLGPLGFIFAATPYLPPLILLAFATAWGAGSVGFPMGLYGSNIHEQCFGRHMARLVLMSFSLLVLYVMYLSMTPISASVSSPPSPSTTDLPPATPPGYEALTSYFAVLGFLVMAGHILAWVTGCRTGSDEDEDDSKSIDNGLDTSDLLQRLNHLTLALCGICHSRTSGLLWLRRLNDNL